MNIQARDSIVVQEIIPDPAPLKKDPDLIDRFLNFFKPKRKEDVTVKLKRECTKFEDELAKLKSVVKQLNDFVTTRPELYEVFLKHFDEHSQFVVDQVTLSDHRELEEAVTETDKLVNKLTKLRLSVNNYNFYIRECYRFIEKNNEVYLCFNKYYQAALKTKQLVFHSGVNG